MKSTRHPRRFLSSVRRSPWLICCGLLCTGAAGYAQDSIRPSATGAEAASIRQTTELPQHYNLRAGPVAFTMSSGLDIEVNDNINLSENHREADVIFRPNIRIDSQWQVTQLNTLRFSLGLGYNAYASHSNLDTRSVLLDPGSQLSFDVFVGGHLKLNFHDRFAIVQNPVDEPNLSNSAKFDRFQNAGGVTALFDFDALKLVFGYDHFTYESLSSEFNYLDRTEEQFYGTAALRVSDALTVGIDASGSIFGYRTDFNNDGSSFSVGPFFEAQLSPYTRLRVAGGFQEMMFDSGGTNGDHSDYSGWYANITLSQRLNQYWTHALSLGHEGRLGLETNFAEYWYARYIADWRINTRISLNLQAFVEEADESGNVPGLSEDAFRVGATVGVSWRLGERMTMALRYQYVNKDSDLLLRSYYQNVGILSIAYDF